MFHFIQHSATSEKPPFELVKPSLNHHFQVLIKPSLIFAGETTVLVLVQPAFCLVSAAFFPWPHATGWVVWRQRKGLSEHVAISVSYLGGSAMAPFF